MDSRIFLALALFAGLAPARILLILPLDGDLKKESEPNRDSRVGLDYGLTLGVQALLRAGPTASS